MDQALTPPAGSPADLAWLIPVVPAVSAALLLVAGKRLGRWSGVVAILAVGYAAVASTLVFFQLGGQPEGERVFVRSIATWISAGALEVDWAVLVDPLSSVMLLLVTWVGLLIHIYSLGYMHGDPAYHHFFAYLNLFVASMLILVLGESLLTLFVGWELVGLCSYLLIGFWFERRDYAGAAKKAFVVNRVGDVGFMVAMFLVFAAVGSLSFTEVLPAADQLATGTAVAVGLLLLAGATGKSAQIPLYVWLPDAMAGPTPVSALIHAATMVTAGVYLIARTSPIYATVPDVGLVVAWIGAVTALVAALIACAQNDLKRILAYSTVSQLGYMFIGVGLGSYVAGIFHLLTHGFFKALLFLSAGSVMHAMAEETDVWKMGGLWRVMPVTAVTAGLGWLAISGFPMLSGFFSKEEILAAAADTAGAQGILAVGVLVAGLTAFYMTRWFVLIFLGPRRWPERGPTGHAVHPHESPPSMTLPLVVLAVASAVGGVMNLPGTHFLGDWLETVVVPFTETAHHIGHTALAVLAVGIAVVGAGAGVVMYLRPGVDIEALRGRFPVTYGLVLNKFYVDEFYSATIVTPGYLLARGLAEFDQRGIDGAVNGVARLTAGIASVGRRVQTGFVRSYALAVLAGAVLVTALFLGGLLIGQVS